MKKFKLLKTVLGLAVVVSLILTPIEAALASQLDQSNDTNPISQVYVKSYTTCGQTFKPSLPQLDMVALYLGNGGNQNVTMRIIRVADGQTAVGVQKVIADVWDWYFFQFSGGVQINAGEMYKIVLSSGSNVMWQLGLNNYANGKAILDIEMDDRDAYFRTYGTPASSPSATPSASPTSTTSPAPGSGVVGSAPSQNIDTSIKVPQNLKAQDVSDRDKNEPKVKLTWEASATTDINGYRVYAKKDGEADFALAADINKATLEYTDAKIAFDTKYNYMVRANKSDKESENSNEVIITPKKETRELKVFGYLSFGGPIWKQWQFWTLVALGLALVGFVLWYVIGRMKAKKSQKIMTESLKS